MKQRILLITNIYSDPDINILNKTDVCHYFAKEWVKMGHEVKVIYNYTIYLKALHFVSKFFEKFIANWSESGVNTFRQDIGKKYILDNVKVEKIPIYKAIPRTKFPQKSIIKQISKIITSNKKDDFTPDIIIGHFHNPSLELVSLLKKEYKVKGCVILHGDTSKIKEMYKNNYKQLINSIDVWGYRSIAIGKIFESIYGKQQQTFICYSGVPEEFLNPVKSIDFSENIKKFIYVGSLIKRKNPVSLIYALDKVYSNKKFSITYVGQGVEKKKMMKAIKKLNLMPNINFLGHISRDDVSAEIESSESFIMVSNNETFGLVFLEAMAKGCITIGSRNEGIDGVIIDGKNGFLCEAGNHNELAAIINKINSLTSREKSEISLNAIKTAKNLTDFKVAEKYIETVISYAKK